MKDTCWLCYIVGECEMGSEGYADILYPMISHGATDEEIISNYKANLVSLYGEDPIGEVNYDSNGGMMSYYPIHKVMIPRNIYGSPESLSILINYHPHKDAKNPKHIISDNFASKCYTGIQLMKTRRNNNE